MGKMRGTGGDWGGTLEVLVGTHGERLAMVVGRRCKLASVTVLQTLP